MRRRLVTIPLLVIATALATATAPAWLAAAFCAGLIRRRRFVILRVALFVFFYLWMELAGVAAMTVAWLGGRGSHQGFHHGLQRWWAGKLFGAVRALLGLTLSVEGEEALAPGPFIVVMRHSSMADTLLPAAILSARYGIRLRYVLKHELLLDPCLDIAGGRLKNHFVKRSSPGAEELEAIAALAKDMNPDEAVLIYPEGTRFSEGKRARRIARLERESSPRAERAHALRKTLLPKTGGVSALRTAEPGLDVVVFAHHGFESFATWQDLFSGDLVGATVRVRFWRITARSLDDSARAATARWLDAEWARVDDYVHQCETAKRP